MSKVKFLPFVGSGYKSSGFGGRRVLALGESHYCANASEATPDITRRVIEELCDPKSEHEAYKNTYTKFAQALLGRNGLTASDKGRLWDSIAFYNFVQVPMTGARVAPTAADFAGSADAFFEVLETLRPDVVIAWGNRLYENLPDSGRQGAPVVAPDGRQVEMWVYALADGSEVRVVPIMHPSSSFSPDYWHRVLTAVI